MAVRSLSLRVRPCCTSCASAPCIGQCNWLCDGASDWLWLRQQWPSCVSSCRCGHAAVLLTRWSSMSSMLASEAVAPRPSSGSPALPLMMLIRSGTWCRCLHASARRHSSGACRCCQPGGASWLAAGVRRRPAGAAAGAGPGAEGRQQLTLVARQLDVAQRLQDRAFSHAL